MPLCRNMKQFSHNHHLILLYIHLTHSYLEVKGSKANSADPDQTSHNVASDQGLQCLETGFSIKNRMKATKQT